MFRSHVLRAAALAACISVIASAPASLAQSVVRSVSSADATQPQYLTLVRAAVSRCWQVDPTRFEQPPTPVTIEFHLKPNGTLAGRPSVVPQRGMATSVPLVQSAVQAVQACAPYPAVPAALLTDGRANIRMIFDASGAQKSAPKLRPATTPAPRVTTGQRP